MPFLTRFAIHFAFVAVFAASALAQVTAHSTRMEVVHGKPYVMVMVNG